MERSSWMNYYEWTARDIFSFERKRNKQSHSIPLFVQHVTFIYLFSTLNKFNFLSSFLLHLLSFLPSNLFLSFRLRFNFRVLVQRMLLFLLLLIYFSHNSLSSLIFRVHHKLRRLPSNHVANFRPRFFLSVLLLKSFFFFSLSFFLFFLPFLSLLSHFLPLNILLLADLFSHSSCLFCLLCFHRRRFLLFS